MPEDEEDVQASFHRIMMEWIISGMKKVPDIDVISRPYTVYQRGRKMRRDGKPCPEKPSDDDDGNSDAALLWIGYRVELDAEFEKKKDVCRLVGAPDPEFTE